eukprot:CAMPEP_0201895718 /NCGR_PEP_ID=MMETSP0902-20130614/43198_1 /ASSEMBLY_ACC=CAM_ASM_000551 /TAXON_ID=420261 /ORGANISM="Thalassiosira antarctica, Strain CCMP982" /LENGTH=326 /DNA_ID=CAMNT_0048428119 /DNA_START=126 /DNA_END=1103 /DNA_ORIENTATION=+
MGNCQSASGQQVDTRPNDTVASQQTRAANDEAIKRDKLKAAKAPQPLKSSLKKSSPQDNTPSPTTDNDSEEKTPVGLILNLTDNKPLDASDVTVFHNAKKEIQRIRKFAKEFLDNIEEPMDPKEKDEHDDKAVREALYDKQDFSSFKKISYDKTDAVRTMIYDAIKPNVLFEHDTKEEMLQIIDVFKPHTFSKGDCVISQGDEGSQFYVVESGELSIHVTVKGDSPEAEQSEVKVGDYSTGSAFGELALIFGSPRAATITATVDCKLWSIERMAYRSIMNQLRYEQHVEKNAFIRTCVVSDRRFTDIFDGSQIEDLTIATKVDTYE